MPTAYFIAGCNGAGKTTFATKFLPNHAGCFEFVNADLIAKGLSPFAPENVAIQAGRLTLERVEKLAAAGVDFALETTLSGRVHLQLVRTLKQRGYAVVLFYIWIPSPDVARERIVKRVSRGGHHIPDADVERRFDRSLQNLFSLYVPVVDRVVLVDNSGEEPQIVAECDRDKWEVEDPARFEQIMKQAKQ